MLRFAKQVVLVTLFALFAGCAGGSGCSSCGGVTPLPHGFPPNKRVENAASVRLTQSGLAFLQDNVSTLAASFLGDDDGAGVINVPINTINGTQTIEYWVCESGPDDTVNPKNCTLEIDLQNAELSITTEPPHHIRIAGTLPVRLQKLPLRVEYFCVPGIGCLESNINAVLTGNGQNSSACPGNNQSFAPFDLDVGISIEIDTEPTHARYGYSQVKVTIDEQKLADDINSSLYFCGDFDADILNFLLDIVGDLVLEPLLGVLTEQIDEALCQSADDTVDPPCPDGTTNVEGVCRYGTTTDAACASIILGTEGNFNIGELLAGFSPGTRGTFDFVLAAGGHSQRDDGTVHHWGDLNTIGFGATLGFYGGTEPMPLSSCVPLADVKPPQAIPIPNELMTNEIAGWPDDLPGPHFGFALSEAFTNFMFAQLHNSGALCIGITADTIDLLSTALLQVGLGTPSMLELGRLKKPAAVAIAIRPTQPADVQFGNGTDAAEDPLIRLTLRQLAIDFYVWSHDRYVRAMTVSFDIELPANLEVTPDGLQPVLGGLSLTNSQVSNSKLIREDPAKIAASLEGLVGDLVGQLLGSSLPNVNVNEQLAATGLALDIPPTVEGQGSPGLRRLVKGTHDYLGIFASLSVATTAEAMQADTQAELVGIDIDPAGLVAATFDGTNGPKAELLVSSSLDDGTRRVEYQYRLDGGMWRPFTTRRFLDVHDSWLRIPGKHIVEVRSRVVGQVHSLDPTPAVVEIVIDGQPPAVSLAEDREGLTWVNVSDLVTRPETVQVRLRRGHTFAGVLAWGDWSEWTAAGELGALDLDDASHLEVEARDEEGNVGSIAQPLIRGRGAGGEGCECTLSEGPQGGGSWPVGALVALLLATAVARRRSASRPRVFAPRRSRVAAATLGALVTLGAGLNAGCNCSEDAAITAAGCRGRGDCEVLRPGLIGSYTSAVVGPDGTLWAAGYLEANWEDGWVYGDLVVGRYDGTQIDWAVVDGVPGDAVDAEQFDPQGFRGGQTAEGDDVGLWTSIAVDEAGNPAVAYYDATNRALRFAQRTDGRWASEVVQVAALADVGRYAKLVRQAGVWAIAYQFIEPGQGGAVRSGVRVARGGLGSWAFVDAATDALSPCASDLCETGTVCVVESNVCQTPASGCAECADGEECVIFDGTAQCKATRGTGGLQTYPDALGLYVSAAPRTNGTLGLAFYDRIRGNLMVATESAGAWQTLVVDGQDAAGVSTGDKGIGTTLAIDASDTFHIAYVDGLDESLRYVTVAGGTAVGTPEVVDNGSTVGGQPHGDGVHVVGDDAHIVVTQGGEVRISYQDATVGTLRLAVGTASGEGHTWALSAIEQEGFAGFFSQQVNHEGTLKILNWWRVAAPVAEGNVRLVTQ